MINAAEISPAYAKSLLDATRNARLETLTEKRGAWYTFADGQKARGADAADEVACARLAWANLAPEPESEPKGKYADAPMPHDMKEVLEQYEDGTIFYPSEAWPTQTKKQYNPKQPATIFTCDCGTRRIVHLQDVKQTAGRCVKCIRRERRRRARERVKAVEGGEE